MPRALLALVLPVFVLVSAPVVAMSVALSTLQASDAVAGAAAISPAVWGWAAAGVAGLAAMVAFGATVVRRERRSGAVRAAVRPTEAIAAAV